MTTPAEVVAAATKMTSGSRLDRARAGMQAIGLFGQLSTAEKRDLAVLVAQRVAPELVPRIQSEGPVELTEEQSRAVLDMVKRLDGDDLQELHEVVATPETRRRALASIGASTADATGLDDVVTDESGPGVTIEDRPIATPAEDTETSRLQVRVEVLERQLGELHDQLADAEAALRDAEEAREQAEQDRDQAREETRRANDRAEDAERTADRARADTRAAEDRFRRFRDRAMQATGSAGPVGGEPTPSTGVSPVVPVTTSADETDRLVARLADGRAGDALRLVVASAASIAGMDRPDRRRTLLTVPDGWARRRALQRLVEAEAVPADEAADLLATLSSVGAQVFAATSMLQTGLARVDDLVAAMDPAAAARLQRRVPA